MKHIGILLVLLLWFSLGAYAQKPASKEEVTTYVRQKSGEVDELWKQKQYQKAVQILQDLYALPALSEMEDARMGVLYNLACGYSLLGEKEKAISFLHDAIESGYSDFRHIREDTDLDNIRNEPRFREEVAKLASADILWNSQVFRTPYKTDISRDEKVAGLSLFWSEVKYNFVFTETLAKLHWDSLYLAYLPLVQQTKSTAEYYRLMSKLCALLHDAHTNINPPSEAWAEQFVSPRVSTWIVNDTVLILGADDSLQERGIRRGMELVRIDGVPARRYAEENVIPYIAANTPQDLRRRAFGNLLLAGPQGTYVELELRDSAGTAVKRTLYRPVKTTHESTVTSSGGSQARLLEFKVLPGNIAYVSLDSFGDERIVTQFDSIFASVEKTDALILDVRGNGGGSSDNGWKILGYLTAKPFQTSQWRTRDYRPSYRAWGRGERWYSQAGSDFQPNGSKLYTKPVVVLTGPMTFSAAEDFCVAFDCMKRGTMIGRRTGGSTGQPLFFILPGGGSARVCTKHDRYPDGREFVGIGVIPSIEVNPSVRDVLSGHDNVLDAALDFLKTKLVK
jgi:carboxyl-terminal processing protease